MGLDVNPWPVFAEDEIQAAVEVLKTGKVSSWTGEQVRLFENEFAQNCACNFALAVSNGSVALELALRALDIGAGDEVIVTARSYIATASSVALCGATPVFADVDADSQNITAATIRPLIGARTKVILVVHFAGWPCDMVAIKALADEHQIVIVEDCAQAQSGRIGSQPVGSFGDIAAFSFSQDKIMTTAGEGGMVVTNDERLMKKMWAFRENGKSYDAVHLKSHPVGYRWVHESIGSNFRMSEIQAAVGRLQLRKTPGWLKRRASHAHFLADAWQDLRWFRIPMPPVNVVSAWYRFYIFIRPEISRAVTRDQLLMTLNDIGVPCFTGTCPELYREKAIVSITGSTHPRLATARKLGETSVSFLVHPTISEQQLGRLADAVRKEIIRFGID